MLLTLKSLIKEHARLGFLYIFSTILNSQIITLLAYQIKKNKFDLPARLFRNHYYIFKKNPAYSFILVCLFMNLQKMPVCLFNAVCSFF